MAERRPALGKGLSALIPDAPQVATPASTVELAIDQLVPNDDQPRLQMDDARLEELSRSIRASGIIQPIVVRRDGASYRIIAGERRWRAARLAGLAKVPVVVREVAGGSHQEILQLALVENIQREDLNAIDEATAYRRLVDEFQLTQEQIANAVGKDRSTVANVLRLLKLPADVRTHIAGGALSMGHARALLSLPDEAAQRQAAQDIVSRSLSVREAEALVRARMAPAAPVGGQTGKSSPQEPSSDVHTRAAEDRLRFVLGATVRINRKGHGGTLEIRFNSEAELNRIYELITEKR